MLNLKKIRRLWISQALSQTELAKKAGVSLPTVSRAEQGMFTHPHPRTVRQLAVTLGVTPAELYTNEGEDER